MSRRQREEAVIQIAVLKTRYVLQSYLRLDSGTEGTAEGR